MLLNVSIYNRIKLYANINYKYKFRKLYTYLVSSHGFPSFREGGELRYYRLLSRSKA